MTKAGVFRRVWHAIRAGDGDVMDTRSDRGWLVDWSGGGSTASGEVVTATTALTLPALFAAVRNPSEDFAALPVLPRKNRATRGSDAARDHPAYRVLHVRPNPLQGPFDYRRVMQFNAYVHGHAYARVVRGPRGEPAATIPLHPDRVIPPDPAKGTTAYKIRRIVDSGWDAVAVEDMLHIQAIGGMGLIGLARESVGIGLAAQRFGGAFFGEHLAPRIVASIPQMLKPAARAGLRKRIEGDRENDPVGSRKIPILEGDVNIHRVGISPQDAQYLETRKFTVEDLARLTRVPLAKLQADIRAKGWSTLELENTDYTMDCLTPLTLVWNQEEARVLLTDDEVADGYYIHTALQARMRGDYTSRTAGYQRAIASGWMSPNDARDLEDMNPIEDPAGDMYYLQGAMLPLQAIAAKGAEDEAEEPDEDEGDEETPPPFPPAVPEDDEDDAEAVARQAAALAPVFEDVARRLVLKEVNATRRALKKHAGNASAFEEWAENFAAKHREESVAAFLPVAKAFGLDGAAGDHLRDYFAGLGPPDAQVITMDLLEPAARNCAHDVTAALVAAVRSRTDGR